MADTDNKQVMSRRNTVLERLKNRYPDKDFSDEESIYGQISDDYDGYDRDIAGFQEREKVLLDLFDKNPKAAQFITDMAKGKDPWLAVIERLGIDGITELMNDPEKKAEYAAKNEEYVANVAKNKELDEEYDRNNAESAMLIDKVQQERGLSDDVRDKMVATIKRIAQDAIIGKIAPETIDMVLNAITHDADVDNARSEGMVAGKNAKIEERLRKPSEGDGLPVSGGSSVAPARNRGGFNIFDEARGAE